MYCGMHKSRIRNVHQATDHALLFILRNFICINIRIFRRPVNVLHFACEVQSAYLNREKNAGLNIQYAINIYFRMLGRPNYVLNFAYDVWSAYIEQHKPKQELYIVCQTNIKTRKYAPFVTSTLMRQHLKRTVFKQNI